MVSRSVGGAIAIRCLAIETNGQCSCSSPLVTLSFKLTALL
jgi:hypothetical protein